MKVKVEKVNIGVYEYDSIVVNMDNKKTEIVFKKECNVSKYDGKEIELINDNGIYKIKPFSVAAKKND